MKLPEVAGDPSLSSRARARRIRALFPPVRRRGTFLLLGILSTLILAVATAAASDYVPGQLLVKYRAGLEARGRLAVESLGSVRTLHRFTLVPIDHVELPAGESVEDAIARLRRDPAIEYAEPNYRIHIDRVPNDPRFPELYALRNTGQGGGTPGADIHATAAWDVGTGNPALKIGVLDTGIDYTHPDLAVNVWTNSAEANGAIGVDDDSDGYIDDIHGYDFVNNDGDPMDDNGHGTHVAGTLAAVGDNSIGVTGVCWGARLVPIKCLDNFGGGVVDNVIGALEFAVAVGVRLTNNSWSGAQNSQALVDAILAAGQAGQLFIAAAGNSGADLDVSPNYPSSFNSGYIISVAATDSHDRLAPYSNYGVGTVDMAAPGDSILSTMVGGQYGYMSGTSMATPMVAGVAALIWSRFLSYTPFEVRSLMIRRADHVAALDGKVAGGLRLNALAMAGDDEDTPPARISDLTATAVGSNSVTLAWTATGEDSLVGRATRYDLRYSTAPITPENFLSARAVDAPDPLASGSHQTFEVGSLRTTTRYYFAIVAIDAVGNRSVMSNLAMGVTLTSPAIAVAPGSFATTLLTGGTKVQHLTITNTAGGTLDFAIPQPLVIAATGGPAREFTPIAKGEADARRGDPVLEGNGGPDAYGYRWSDSHQPGGPVFSWIDITTIGTSIPLTSDDETSPRIPLGMAFPFYGRTLDSARVSTNGFLTLADTVAAAYNNQPLPSPLGGISDMIAPFWDDLTFAGLRHAYSYTDGDRFIVSWIDVSHLSGAGPYSFQVILDRSGDITFQYLRVPGAVSSATVGIEDSTRTIGLTAAFNTPYLESNLAIRFRRIPQWLSLFPISGRVPAGASQDVEVRYDATQVSSGDSYANITVISNDPRRPRLQLPVHLRVNGAPDLGVTPTAIAFDSVQVNASPTRTLTLRNQGVGDLTITSVTSNDPAVTLIGGTAFTLTAGASRAITVRYAPIAVSVLDALLTIASNDPDSPAKTVRMTGRAIPAPVTLVSPESLVVTLAPNTATTRTIHVTNQGTGDYVFHASVPLHPLSAPSLLESMPAPVPQVKGDNGVPGPRASRAGGPDRFGYTYADSDEPNGPAFQWVDIRGNGTLLPMAGDDENAGPFPIGFSFPFYGNTFDSFRVSTNGFVTFTSILDAFTNSALPNNQTTPPMPENLLAAFWDDLNFTPTPSAYYGHDGTRLVVQYQSVPRYGETRPNTFEILLYPDGKIEYQYLEMRGLLSSCTVGMQNATKDDGITVVYNAPYLKDSLTVRFTPPANLLSVNPDSGVVAPAGQIDLNALISTSGLVGGTYRSSIVLEGNDPVRPTITIPCRVDVVGRPDIAAVPDHLSFGTVFIGFPDTLDLEVRNNGTDVLTVSQIQSSDPAFTADATAFAIGPQGRRIVRVRFAPSQVRSYPATLTITSDDPDTPSLVVPLSGAGVGPPVAHVTPAQVPVALANTLGPTAQVELKTVVIENTGGADLHWHARANAINLAPPGGGALAGSRGGADAAWGEWWAERRVAVDESNGGQPPKNAPAERGRPVLEASGGPDAAGYRWLDSDDPGGPPFAWADITTAGTSIPFWRDDQTSPPIALPFVFPFYDHGFSSVRVCSNGWLSFTSNDSAYFNWPLPNTALRAPANLIAPYWDDMDFRAGGQVFYAFDGQRFIVSYVGAPHWTSPDVLGGTYTFQVLLYPSGQIDFQYLTVSGPNQTSATIGLQNEDKSIGLQVAYNTAYVHNGLRVKISRLPPWLSVLPDSGVVEPGGRDTLRLRCDATGVPDGDHESTVEILSNDPLTSRIEVPVHLHVGATTGALTLDPAHHASNPPPSRVAARVTPPTCAPQSIDPSSVRLVRSVPVAAGAPVTVDGCDAIFEFNRLALFSAIPGGAAVPVDVIAELTGTQWFHALDTLRMLRPTLDRDPDPYTGGATVQIIWTDAPGSPPSTYDLWFSPDSGASWSPVTAGLTGHSYTWTAPASATTRGFLELVANDLGGAFVGSTFSGPFEITGSSAATIESTSPPLPFGLALTSGNPSVRTARWTLSLPRAGTVEANVYDVRGALVRRLAAQPFAAGRHALVWDGADPSGRPAGSGVYFVQARAGGQIARSRVVLVR
jgi:subtilisin family serine protease